MKVWADSRAGFWGIAGLGLCTSANRDRLARYQTRTLRALVRHAYDHVPYYRQRFDRAGVAPDAIRTLDDLARIPLTDRAALRDVPEIDRIAHGIDPSGLILHRTSGSTGAPLDIRTSWLEEWLLRAYRLRVEMHLGQRIGDRRADIARVRRPTPFYRHLGVLRNEFIDCFEPADRLLAHLREIRPDVLTGFPALLTWLADAASDADRQAIRPRLIMTGAETLTADMRARIVRAFGAQIFDFYGSHELNLIAWECPATRLYHVSDSSIIAEVLVDGRPARPGEVGELVGTALHRWAMPMIRVKIGDFVTRGPDRCSCGIATSMLVSIDGRVADRFYLPDGRSVHASTVVGPVIADTVWVRRYQVVQERLDRFIVKVVPMSGEAVAVEELDLLAQRLRHNLGGQIEVQVRTVREIPLAASGKLLPFVPLAVSHV